MSATTLVGMTLDLSSPVDVLARQLMDIPSVSGEETVLADAVEQALNACAHLSVMRDGDAIVARTELGRAERVAVVGHLDTVPVAGNLPARVEDGVLRGRGSVDMKAGVAVHLSLAAALTEPSRDITWIFYDHEEVDEELNGLGRLARNHPGVMEVSFAVLGEPTSGALEGGCNGTIRVEVSFPGVAAHSARSWKGVNAIHAAGPLLEALANYDAATVEVDGLEYREGLNAVGISGGIAGNVIPDICTVTLNYRFAPAITADEAIDYVTGFVQNATSEATITVVDRAEGCRPGLDAQAAQQLAEAVAASGAGAPRAKVGWTDVARFGALGIPAVNYGPGNPELAHADDERVDINEIHQVREGMRAWLDG